MKAAILGSALLSLILVTGGASAMDSDALKEARAALDQDYTETMEAMEAMEEAMEDRIATLEAEVEALKREQDAQANQ